eukprot:89200-Rhodomonas_salina.1
MLNSEDEAADRLQRLKEKAEGGPARPSKQDLVETPDPKPNTKGTPHQTPPEPPTKYGENPKPQTRKYPTFFSNAIVLKRSTDRSIAKRGTDEVHGRSRIKGSTSLWCSRGGTRALPKYASLRLQRESTLDPRS